MSKIFLLTLLVPVLCAISQERFKQIPIDIKSLDDSTNYVDIKEYHLRIIYPKGEIHNPPYKYVYMKDLGSVTFSPLVWYGDFTIADFRLETRKSVRLIDKQFEIFIAKGGELEGDGEPPETEKEFLRRESLLAKGSKGNYFDEFTLVDSLKYGHRRYHSEPCGCIVSESYTYIGKTRITIFLNTYGDGVKQRVEKIFHDKYGDHYTYGDEFQQAVANIMREEFLKIISKIHFVKL